MIWTQTKFLFWFTAFLPLFGFGHGTDYSDNEGKRIYVSALSGKDTDQCGSPEQPCHTIVRAVQKATWGDIVYIDGSGTEQSPYNCQTKTTPTRRVNVKLGIALEGHTSTVFVSCSGGFFFEEAEVNRELRVALSNIIFSETSLHFTKCSHVEIKNCFFKDNHPNKPAIDFQGPPVGGNVSFLVKTSTFENNALCINFDFTGNLPKDTAVIVDIENASFRGNTRGGNPGRAGGILITNSTAIKGLLHLRISCKKIVYNENRGPFICVEIPEAISSESYSNIEFVGNEENLRKIYRKGFWGSLYVSRVRKTNVSFASIHCENNSNIRCFGFASKETYIKIRDSLIARQKVKDQGSALYVAQTNNSVILDLRNTSFTECSAREGGAIYVDRGSGTVNITVYNVHFIACNASTAGSVMIVGGYTRAKKSGEGIRVLRASFQNVTVTNCLTGDPWDPLTPSSERDFGAMSFSIGERGTIFFGQSIWTGNAAPSCAAVSIETHGQVDVDVTESHLAKNYSPKLCIFCVSSWAPSAGTITFDNNVITDSATNALCLSPLLEIVLTNLLIARSKYAALVIKIHSGTLASTIAPFEAKTRMENCTFHNNLVNIMCTLNTSRLFNFTSRDSLFLGGSSPQIDTDQTMPYNIYIQMTCAHKMNNTKALFIFDNVTFDSANPTKFDLKSCKGNKTILVKKSVFRHSTIQCIAKTLGCKARGDDVQLAGAIAMLFRHDKDRSKGCISKKNHNNTHPTWNYESFAVFEDTTFDSNEGLLAGAVFVVNGYTLFRRCSFTNNFSLRQGGHVSVSGVTGKVEFAASTLIQTTAVSRAGRNNHGPTYFPFIYSESSGPLTIANSTLLCNVSTTDPHLVLVVTRGGYVNIEPTTQINCSVGNKLSFENNTHYIGTYQDQSCQINMTVLSFTCGLCPPGMYSLENGFALGLNMEHELRCLPCPFGAACLRNVAAKPNFYGYLVSNDPPALNFSTCPEGYCSPPQTKDTAVYNGCLGNRSGLLCGRCSAGFTESLFSCQCRKVSECGQPWFWLIAVVVMVALSGYLVWKPPLIEKLSNNIFWWRRNSANTEPSPTHSDNGYLKITFYFYQVSDILLLDSVSEVTKNFPFILPIVGMFTFQVRVFDQSFGCPLTGLTVVTKELFLSLGFFVVLMCIVVTYVGHLLVSYISNLCKKPSLLSYLVVVIETLLLGYEILAETTLKLLQCVPMGSEWRLFYDGNVQCLQWWQYIFIGYGVVFLLPFIAVLYWGTLLLSKKRISAKEFLAACFLPLPFLLRWIVYNVTKTCQNPVPNEHGDEEVSEVSEVLYGPFQRPPDQSGPLYWESVLIGRRLVLLSIHSFVTNPMVRLAVMTVACLLITVHHVIQAPYRDRKANALETMSLISLTILGITNLSRATFLSTGVTPGGSSETFFVFLQRFETVMLGLVPVIFLCLAALAVLSQMVRCLVNLAKYVMVCKPRTERRNSCCSETDPLLKNSSSGSYL